MISRVHAIPQATQRFLTYQGRRDTSHAPDYWLLTILLTLIMFGTVMVFSASFAIGVREEGGNAYSYLIRQLTWVGIGLVGMFVTMSINYRAWRRFSLAGMGLVILLLAALAFVPGLGVGAEEWGAKRWILVGPIQFQPSELAKIALVIYMADWLGQKGAKIQNFSYGLLPFSIVLGVTIGLVMLQPDLGTSALLAAIGISIFLVAGADLLQFGGLMFSGLVAFLVLALSAPYRRERMLVFLNPDIAPLDLGWQLSQARIALGTGGIFGLGLGASRQKFTWLPAAHNDAIFAVIGEELGLVGAAFVLFLFIGLAWRGYRIAMNAPDTFGTLVAVGIVTWMTAQAAINIGGITMTIPFTGIPLPFISYGGTALVVTLTAMGILLNISRYTVDHPEESLTPSRSRAAQHTRPVRSRSGRRTQPKPIGRTVRRGQARAIRTEGAPKQPVGRRRRSEEQKAEPRRASSRGRFTQSDQD